MADNFVDNDVLMQYLEERKKAQTEIEIKNIMSKIYENIALNAKLFYAFSSDIPPMKNELGENVFSVEAEIRLSFIYSLNSEAYFPIYTSVEESQKRSNVEEFPYIKQASFNEIMQIVNSYKFSKIYGIVINPLTDNLIISPNIINYIKNIQEKVATQPKVEPKVESKVEPIIENKTEVKIEKNISNEKVKTLSNVSKNFTSGSSYTKVNVKGKTGILVNEYDLRILEYSILPSRVIKYATNFAKENKVISALWTFDRRYYLPNDNTQYLSQLIVVEDELNNEDERKNLYEDLKNYLLPQSNTNEIVVEMLGKQRGDFVRKNALLPFYQKINI